MIKRYSRSKMADIWSEENRFAKMMEVELLACQAQSELGKIPKKALEIILKKAKFQVDRINQIEKETRHDVVAFVKNLSENIGPEGRFLHNFK